MLPTSRTTETPSGRIVLIMVPDHPNRRSAALRDTEKSNYGVDDVYLDGRKQW